MWLQLAEALDIQISTEEQRIDERAKRLSIQMATERIETMLVTGQLDQSSANILAERTGAVAPSGRASMAGSPERSARRSSLGAVLPLRRISGGSRDSMGAKGKWQKGGNMCRSLKRMGTGTTASGRFPLDTIPATPRGAAQVADAHLGPVV